jgi:hypothetical protein
LNFKEIRKDGWLGNSREDQGWIFKGIVKGVHTGNIKKNYLEGNYQGELFGTK